MPTSVLRLLQKWIQPLCLLWLFLTCAVLISAWRRRWRSFGAWLVPWTLMTVFSCTNLPSTLVYSLERPWQEAAHAVLPPCDAVVCLGGGAEPSPCEPTGFHLVDSGDRLTTALGALSSTHARELVLGGGSYKKNQQWHSEADAVKRWLDTANLTPVPVTSLGACSDTHDEAQKVAALCAERGWKQVLLVTSASHMNRAAATFRKAGVPVVCLPCNFHSSMIRIDDERSFWHPPHPETLQLFNIWCHEFAGWQVYRRRGWL